jgi:O-antigen/teichoic acid export membrane protein/aminoglycoside phosphotransferase
MTSGITATVATHLREPMRRSAYALVAGTGVTSILGMAFWVLTARLLPAEAVGTGSALISAMTFLGTLSTLGLRNAMVRFLAPAGASARRLIVTCYLLCASAAILAAVIFIAGQPLWASKLDFLRQDRVVAVAFVAATAVWVLFILEDHVLIGLRRAGWVPVTNGVYSAVKIALLPALVSGTAYGLFAAFALPAAPIVALVTILVLRIAGQQRGEAEVEDLRIPQLVRFAIADHSSAFLWLATTELLTLVVLQKTDAEASAYYFMSFTIAYSLFLVSSNVGSAFVAEAARYPGRAVALAGKAFRHAASLVVPLSLVGVALAPLGLRILGKDYSTNGTVLLRLLLLSAIPQVVIGIALGAARVRRDNRLILAVYVAQAFGVFGGTILTIDRWGLTGVGLSWLVTQTTVALVLILTRRTGTESIGIELGGVVDWAGKVVSRVRRQRNRRLARHVVAPALSACGLESEQVEYRLLPSDSDSLILALAGQPEPGVLKIATTAAASRGLDRHADTLSELCHSLDASQLLALVPRVLERGTVQGRTVLLETRLPGVTTDDRVPEAAALEAAAAAIGELHRSTSSALRVDRALRREWVDAPMKKLRRIKSLTGAEVAFGRLTDTLYGALYGQRVITSYVHGDYWLGNILMGPDSETVEVTGIVDWENARRVGLPDCDIIHLWLTSQPGELGVTVRRAVLSPDSVNSAVGGLGMSRTNPQVPTGRLVLLAWLWHVTAELDRASRNQVGRLWLARTVKPVLKLMGTGGTRAIFDGER